MAVGVDLGGTWVRVVALERGRPIATLAMRAARVPRLERFLRETWRRRRWAPGRVEILVVAARGVWTGGERRALARRLQRLAGRVRVIADAEAALLGALGDRPGVLLLAGTGSIAIGRDAGGRLARAGGLGPLVGDDGSAFWLGREWLRVTGDGGSPAVRRLVTRPDAVARIATLAPDVLARARGGDRRARAIVRDGQARLAALARQVARRLDLRAPLDLSWSGSLLADPWYRSGVKRAVARLGLRARWHSPAVAPVLAAARLAESLARS